MSGFGNIQVLQDSSSISNMKLREVSPEAWYCRCLLSTSYFSSLFFFFLVVANTTHEPFKEVMSCNPMCQHTFPLAGLGCVAHVSQRLLSA